MLHGFCGSGKKTAIEFLSKKYNAEIVLPSGDADMNNIRAEIISENLEILLLIEDEGVLLIDHSFSQLAHKIVSNEIFNQKLIIFEERN